LLQGFDNQLYSEQFMKRHVLAFTAIFLCLLSFAALVLNRPNAPSASAAPLLTTTPSFTPTATATATGTLTVTPTATTTPTLDPCSSAPPPAPLLRKPADGATLDPVSQKVKLDWKPADCALTYRVKVYRDSKDGALVSRKKGLTKTNYTTKELSPGHTYFWAAEACNAAGCTRSKFRDFYIPPPPTESPRPTRTPMPTSTPAAPPPYGVANWQGPSVYLGPEDPVYYFDCGWKWRPQGDIVLIIAVGFTPGERVFYQAYEISSNVVSSTGNYIAASNGWVNTAVNTSAWAGGHYHLIFTGQTSRVSQCGHFDLDHGPAITDPGPDIHRGPHKE
jgi:hypothetical protein